MLHEKQDVENVDLTSKEIFERLKQKREEPIYKYLDSLDMENIKFIQTLMYIGRDYDGKDHKSPEAIYREQKEGLDIIGWKSKSIEINQMLGKAPLAKYLRSGLRILKCN